MPTFKDLVAKMSQDPTLLVTVLAKGKEILAEGSIEATPEEEDKLDLFAFKSRMYLGDQMDILRAEAPMHGLIDGTCGNEECTCNGSC